MIVKACWPGSKVLEENPAWSLVRTPLRKRDQTMAPEAEIWLSALPLPVQPLDLCRRYPRIVNRMALLWPDSHLTGMYFKSLLVDKRGGRRGFATRITEELLALQLYYAESRGLHVDKGSWRERLLEELRSVRGLSLPSPELV
ncbi:hypothetical protein BH09PSE5_BH09PSE5_49220 [soil metagenome]